MSNQPFPSVVWSAWGPLRRRDSWPQRKQRQHIKMPFYLSCGSRPISFLSRWVGATFPNRSPWMPWRQADAFSNTQLPSLQNILSWWEKAGNIRMRRFISASWKKLTLYQEFKMAPDSLGFSLSLSLIWRDHAHNVCDIFCKATRFLVSVIDARTTRTRPVFMILIDFIYSASPVHFFTVSFVIILMLLFPISSLEKSFWEQGVFEHRWVRCIAHVPLRQWDWLEGALWDTAGGNHGLSICLRWKKYAWRSIPGGPAVMRQRLLLSDNMKSENVGNQGSFAKVVVFEQEDNKAFLTRMTRGGLFSGRHRTRMKIQTARTLRREPLFVRSPYLRTAWSPYLTCCVNTLPRFLISLGSLRRHRPREIFVRTPLG